ncbi:Type I restriction enzyme, S subunit [Cycloclasticus zancles 78-ME]|uniref:Type I restriction enzyme, S subunit n=2 Tax=Cycloclasticus zancles TaxID=1329899 RepID=S5TB57_9GAMM|nr:Type I restriction enzyme, S subunit [Cycloclasticus zancles 78-ME]
MTNLSGANLNNGSAVGSQSEGRDSPSNALAAIPKYQAYKDSGVAWLGELPRQWDAIKMKYLYRDTSVKNKASETLLSVTQTQGVVPREWVENRMVMPSGNLASFKFIKKGDFAISLRSFEGGLEYCHHDGIISPAYTVLKAKHSLLCSGYYKYLFKSQAFISELQTSVVGIREGKNISYEELRYSLLPIPKPQEQFSIANFLDQKTAQIDEAIAIKEKQIALLKERKQIIIQKAVTQGLNPNVPMKGSGVDWMGKVPKHWKVKKLRYLGNTQNGISAGAEYFGEGFPFVSYGDVYKNRVLPSYVKGLAKSSSGDQKLYSVLSGDVFFTRTSETVDEIGFASICFEAIDRATFAGFLIRFRTLSTELTKEFSKYYFNAPMMREYFVTEMNLVIRASLSQELLKNLLVALPPVKEQMKIFEYLEDISEKIDASISLQIEQIGKLKEYKSSLINSAVTGKIKVA